MCIWSVHKPRNRKIGGIQTENDIVKTFKYITEKAKNLSNYSTKLRERLEDLDTLLEAPTQEAGIDFIYETPIHSSNPNYECEIEYQIYFKGAKYPYGLFVRKYVEYSENENLQIYQVKRFVLKKMVALLPDALKAYCEHLGQLGEEYREAYEQINKICEAIEGIEKEKE